MSFWSVLPGLVLCSSLAYCVVYATHVGCRLASNAARTRVAFCERVYDSSVMPLVGATSMYLKSIAVPAVRKGLTRRTLQHPSSQSADGGSPVDGD